MPGGIVPPVIRLSTFLYDKSAHAEGGCNFVNILCETEAIEFEFCFYIYLTRLPFRIICNMFAFRLFHFFFFILFTIGQLTRKLLQSTTRIE